MFDHQLACIHLGADSGPRAVPPRDRFDVVVVGGGAAGLLAAHTAGTTRRRRRILLVDAGLALGARQQAGVSQMVGYGGAGLYLGGRLYVGPTTIPVFPSLTLPAGVGAVLQGSAYTDRMAQVDSLFTRLGVHVAPQAAPSRALAAAVAAAGSAGLDYVTSYPARLLPPAEREAVLRGLLTALETAGVQLAFGTRVGTVARDGDGFRLALFPSGDAGAVPRTVWSRTLILAPGRYGLEWLVGVASALGARMIALPSAFGVRLEVSAAAYAPLTDVNPDPRLQLQRGDTLIKTYATCPGGRVAGVTRYGRLVASGVPRPVGQRGPATTFAVLVQPGAEAAVGIWRDGAAAARQVNERVPGRLALQRLGDVRAGRATTAQALLSNSIQPTATEAQPAPVQERYPEQYWDAVTELLLRIEQLAPGTSAADTLIYAPAEERFWHFPTDEHLQTSVPGLFVAGDGPGQSQGVIQAGVAGLLAGEGAAAVLDA